MNRSCILVCAWAALAVSVPTSLVAQTSGAGGQQGGQKGSQPAGGQQGGKPAGQPGQQGGAGQQGGTPRPAGGQVPPPGQTPPVGQTPSPGAALGQSNGTPQASFRGPLSLRPGDELVGMNLDPRSGEQHLGRINDFVIRADGSIGYAIISSPNAAQGGASYPIPWSQVQYQAPEAALGAGVGTEKSGATGGAAAPRARITARFENDRLKGAPSFDSTMWPRDSMPFDEAERYYGGAANVAGGAPRPAGGTSADGGVGTVPAAAVANEARFRASQFREQAVLDSTGTPIGKVGRIAMDPSNGRVNYVTVVLSNVPGASGRTIAVPWSALQATRVDEQNRLQLTVPADKLQNAPQFKGGTSDWTEMSDPNWVRSVYGYYGVEPYWSSNAASTGVAGQGSTDASTKPSEQPPR